ncbi:MAG TPA: tetratricopeptide repeat protein, partial [Novosphingobium sp.]|nr:tetratricopeptide repeat protein [Novosphingobium sp.]
RLLLAGDAGQGDKHLIIADALTRHGQYADAITVLRGATDADPKDSQAWLAMANALVAKAEGNLSPAALLAFRRAAETDPRAPGPPYFLGLALARSGRFEEARGLWLNVVQNAPANAPWRDHIAQRILRLDRLIVLARQMQAQH